MSAPSPSPLVASPGPRLIAFGMGLGTETIVHLALSTTLDQASALEASLAARGFRAFWLRDERELAARLPEISWLLVGRPPRIDWSSGTRLRLLQVAGMGVDPLFPAQSLARGAFVANVRGAHEEAVRDHVFAAILSFQRELTRLAEQQLRADWTRVARAPLAGKTLVLLGLGGVGRAVASTAQAFGMRVLAVCRTNRQEPGVERVYATAQLLDALASADFVVVCLPLTSRTRQLVNASALAALGPTAFLVDVSRGGVVEELALEAALRSGRLGGAARDVFDSEPLEKSSSLWSCPRLFISPHVAGLTPAYLGHVLEVFLSNIALVDSGRSPDSPVSLEREY